jgi:hypothetical protein
MQETEKMLMLVLLLPSRGLFLREKPHGRVKTHELLGFLTTEPAIFKTREWPGPGYEGNPVSPSVE